MDTSRKTSRYADLAGKTVFISGGGSGIGAALTRAFAELGDIGVLINNAGNDERHALEQVTPAYWDERIAVNMRHMFFAAQTVLPQMKRLGAGAIVNLGSITWRLKQAHMAVYAICKASVVGLTRVLAREFGPFGIRVNTISPGAVWTERQIKLWYTPEVEKEIMAGAGLRNCVISAGAPDSAPVLAVSAGDKCPARGRSLWRRGRVGEVQ